MWQLCETSHVCDLNCVCAAGFQIVVASVPGSALVSVKLLSHVQKKTLFCSNQCIHDPSSAGLVYSQVLHSHPPHPHHHHHVEAQV